MKALPLSFYQRRTEKVAQELLGKTLYHKTSTGQLTAGIITETEAYLGINDQACHTFQGRRTARTESMYKMGGHSYVYFIYGVHYCFNVVTLNEKCPEAVLIRALKPIKGLELMRKRRGTDIDKNLCSGPGKLCQAMAIRKEENGLLLTGKKLWIEENIPWSQIKKNIQESPRIGIPYAGVAQEWPLRFTISL